MHPDPAIPGLSFGTVPDWVTFDAVHAQVAWEQQSIRMFGRQVPMPRLSAWYGDPGAAYTYSGLRNEPLPWTPVLARLRDWLEQTLDAPFDSVLANLYRDGRDHMGWHADDEPELGPEPVIASVSLGATRTFRLKHRQGAVAPVAVELDDRSLVVMRGTLQREFVHCVPRRLRVHAPRINLTFRNVRS